jgi:hypothetical protein
MTPVKRRRLREDRPALWRWERDRVEEQRQWIRDYKRRQRCKLCGGKDGLTFHHRDQRRKRFNIGDGRLRTWSALYREVLKCDVVCRTCHNVLHG